MCQCLHIKGSTHTNAVNSQCQMLRFDNNLDFLYNIHTYFVLHSTYTLLLVVSLFTNGPFSSGWLDCRSACIWLWTCETSSRAVWFLWSRLPAQEEGEGHADGKLEWMVEWIVSVHNLDMAELLPLHPSWDQTALSRHYSGHLLHFGEETSQGVVWPSLFAVFLFTPAQISLCTSSDDGLIS